jgi:hypothetical protein
MEFTYEEYRRILRSLLDSDYSFVDYDTEVKGKSVLLRHDVDWSPRKAVRIAKIENDAGVSSTYFFLLTSRFYNIFNQNIRKKIFQINQLNHDIGLHFSTHQYWDSKPSSGSVQDKVSRELKVLSLLTEGEVDTVAFHNPPDWVIRRDFDEFRSAYETRFVDELEYIADSNQRWEENPFLRKNLSDKLHVLTHPLLWDDYDGEVTERLRNERNQLFENIEEFIKTENERY